MAISPLVERFLDLAKQYFRKEIDDSPELACEGGERVAFADDLLKDVCRRPQEYYKYLNSISTYGYAGLSSGGRNGIVRVRKTDSNLLERINRFLESAKGQKVLQRHGITAEDVEPVKVVAHVMSGKRLIGIRRDGLTVLIDKVGYKK